MNLSIKNKQSGFSTIEIVLVLVIVALIGVVGYMVYKNHNKSAIASSPSNTIINTEQKKVTVTNDSQTISSPDKKIQITIPSTWHIVPIGISNPNGDQIISFNLSTHLCDKYNPSDCSAIAPCLDNEDTVSCSYVAELQPKQLDPLKDGVWGLMVEKTNMTISQAKDSLLGILNPSDIVEQSSNKINGYDALYIKNKEQLCTSLCYVDINYFVTNNGYLIHFTNREFDTSGRDYSSYSPDFAKIVGSLKLNL